MSLKKIRQKVDNLDMQVLKLLNQRAKLSLEIRNIKSKRGRPIFSPDREKEIYKRLIKANKGPMQNKTLEAIYREIMSGSLSLEKPLVIAYFGPEASFTNIAALNKFGSSVDYIDCDSITDVFLEVEKDRADYGVVPIENSTEGVVSHTLDMFVDSDLKICAESLLPVEHNLLSRGSKRLIKRVYSNPQVLAQCRLWLESNLPGVELIATSSTTKAAQIVTKRSDSAAIASKLAANTYKLKVLAESIEDSPHNFTRFLIIGKAETEPTQNDKTSIMFSIKDRVGALHDMLTAFKKNKINLTKIESRPSKKKAWDYYFFVDAEGHYKSPGLKKALDELDQHCKFVKVLGSYPAVK